MILKKLAIKNFKGIHNLDATFNDMLTTISGRNATGKSSIVDAWFWLLFGKNQYGDTKFEIRELNADGEKVHMTEISVEAVIEHEGREIILTRTQVENWVKKRGQEERELSGNKDSFMINGYPKSKAEYEDFIKSILDEKIFRILSSPNTFPNLDWKEQRKILMSMCDVDPSTFNITDFHLIADELSMETPDAVKKKYTEERRRLNKILDTLPTEIDTLHSQIVEVDEKALANEEAALSAKIDEVQSRIVEMGKVNNDLTSAKIAECQAKQRTIISSVNDDRNAKIREAKEELSNAKSELSTVSFKISGLDNRIALKTNTYNDLKEQIKQKLSRYKALKADIESAEFPESETICRYCGQKLPEDKIEDRRKHWQDELSKDKASLDDMQKSGNELALKAKSVADEVDQLKKQLSECEVQKKHLHEAYLQKEQACNDAMNLPISDGTSSPEYQALANEIQVLQSQMKDLSEIRQNIEDLRADRDELKVRLSEVHQKQAQTGINKRLEEQIAEKSKEQRDVAQKITEADRKLFVLEEYVKAVANQINSQFDGLQFKLFNQQLNGGMAECCEITYDGVPYGSLNSGHRIIVGTEIVKTFQRLFELAVPLWIDNAESLSTGNLPKLDSQMIALEVADTDLTFS